MKYQEIIKPFSKIWQFVLANLFVGLAFTLLFSSSYTQFGIRGILIGVIWAALISLTQWLGHAWIGIQLDKKINILKKPILRILAAGITIALYSAVAFVIVQYFFMYLVYNEPFDSFWSWFIKTWHYPVIASFIIAIILNVIIFFKTWQTTKLNEQKLKAEVMTYKYESLKNQINPHFLFNSFNVLSDLIYEDQKLADKFLSKLSELYRYVLDSREKELVMLSKELEFIESYIFLLKIRFEDKIMINNSLKSSKKANIVPMGLQLLIENAVKHNEASTGNPLQINITEENGFVIVSNKKTAMKSILHSDKIGLKNLQQQYSYFTDKKVVINNLEDKFEVKIPLIQS